MKKFITLLLVLAGYVCAMNATTYTVYFKPSSKWTKDGGEVFKLHVWGGKEELYMPFEYLTNGIYAVEYDANNGATGFQFVRYASNGNDVYNYGSDRTDIPTSDVYYDASSNDNWDLTGLSQTLPSSFGTENPSCIIVADSYIANSDENWNTSSTVNKMTYNNNFTYSLSVSEKFILMGAYGYKIYRNGNEWCGDPDNSGSNFPVSITEAGKYTIDYTYNILTGRATATVTQNSAATMKYFVENYDGSTYTELGEMSDVDGNPTLVYSPLSLDNAENDLQYKISWEAYISDEKVASNWTYYSDGVDGRYAYTPTKQGSHTVTFVYYPYYGTSSVVANYLTDNYYYVGGNGDWAKNQENPLKNDGSGVYSITVSNKGGHTFAIIPDYAFSSSTSISNWEYAIHPKAEANLAVGFANNSGLINVANSQINWDVDDDYADYITITLNTNTNEWSVAPYFEREIDGYATFSSEYAVAIPDGVTAYYATAAETGKVTMTSISDGIPANTGAFLKADNDTYKFTPATSTESTATPNLLQPSGSSIPATDEDNNKYRYVYAVQSGVSAFYNVGTEITENVSGKAYLETTSSIKPVNARIAIVFDDDVTGINSVNRETINNNEYYNLAGQRVAQPAKGLYIVNGKKVIKH